MIREWESWSKMTETGRQQKWWKTKQNRTALGWIRGDKNIDINQKAGKIQIKCLH